MEADHTSGGASGEAPAPAARTLRIDLEYDGAGFHGWQTQPGLRTVQGELARALEAVLGHPVRVVGALDTPVPYSPPLEDAFLPSAERVETAARLLLAY